eukprot:7381612-Prymnesium_polylepis.2
MLHAIRRYIDQLEAVRSRAASEAAKVKQVLLTLEQSRQSDAEERANAYEASMRAAALKREVRIEEVRSRAASESTKVKRAADALLRSKE